MNEIQTWAIQQATSLGETHAEAFLRGNPLKTEDEEIAKLKVDADAAVQGIVNEFLAAKGKVRGRLRLPRLALNAVLMESKIDEAYSGAYENIIRTAVWARQAGKEPL